MDPEQRARKRIDELLGLAGWAVQDRAELDLGAARGVAVREFGVSAGEADYLLFVDRAAVGVIEAKKIGYTLTGVEEQNARYRVGLPAGGAAARTTRLWVYDLRTNQNFTLKTNPLTRAHLDDFVAFSHPENRHDRIESERFHYFDYAELAKRDKANLDLFWLRDDSLESADGLPSPDVLAASIVEDLRTALEQFAAIAEDLEGLTAREVETF
jgi:hypothetical protein